MKHEAFVIHTDSAVQTKKIAQSLGEEIARSEIFLPTIIALCGELGAGKTTFVKGLAKGLGIEANITSPTFILISKYKLKTNFAPKGSAAKGEYEKLKTLYHIDPYRLQDTKDILPELKELFTQKNAVIAIEWAERVDKFLPKGTIWIMLKHKGQQKRVITISAKGKTQSAKLQLKT